MNVYLDESGDLGWAMEKPYRKGGSSRFLTIAYIICPPEKKHLLKRIVKKVYSKLNYNPKDELKGSSLSLQSKKDIANMLSILLSHHKDISVGAITVKKSNVLAHIRKDANKLYNYMIRLAVLEHIHKFPFVNLIRDNRSIKVKSGNSLIDYLQLTLWFEYSSKTEVVDIPSDSKKVSNLILTDWINNIVWGHYEDNNNEAFNILGKHIKEKHLFFH